MLTSETTANKLTGLKKTALSLCLLPLFAMHSAGTIAKGTNPLKLPELGTVASSSLTIEKEIRIGKAYKMMMRSRVPIINDPLLEQYINDVGLKLVANADDVKTPFEFFMVENKAINAFAFFGGHVGIHTGLFVLADNESELASVLGHEITHVTQRHLARSIEARQQTSPATMAALLGSIALVMAGAGEAGIAGIQTSLALSQQLAINYTRSNEREADRIGIALTAKSNFDPASAAVFFGKMAAQHRYSTKLPPMLQSHPVTELRIAETRVRAQAYSPLRLKPSLPFLLAKARILVRYNQTTDDAINHRLKVSFDANTPEHKMALNYGKALMAVRLKQYQEALVTIERLRKIDPNNLYFLDTLSDIYIGMKQPQRAITVLEKFNSYMADNAVIALNYASALIEAKEYNKAITKLERFTTTHPQNIAAWSMLVDANQKAGHRVERHIAKAEHLALYGNFKQALKELYQAHNNIKNDQITQVKVQARIKQLRQREQDLKNLKI